MAKTKTVLVCPLDWGLGHATRMVPVIDNLRQKDCRVIIAADRGPLEFLRRRFHDIETIRLAGFIPAYPARGSMSLALLRSYPKMMTAGRKATEYLEKIIDRYDVDTVISDNRYELHSTKVYSVFVTHQLNIQTPGISRFASPFIQRKIQGYISRFDELWIPDMQGDQNLSGDLSHDLKMPIGNTHFIGPLSRFSLVQPISIQDIPEILVLISGPEPQRTILEQLMLKQTQESGLKTTILQGKPGIGEIHQTGNVTLIPHLPDTELAGLIKSVEVVICRPGYSTIMDLAVFGKQAIFIPTPGQTEQEYLARRFLEAKICYMEPQKIFDLKRAIGKTTEYSGLSLINDYSVLDSRINAILSKY
jgi:uncharacterized protein (TIGR00661 family)